MLALRDWLSYDALNQPYEVFKMPLNKETDQVEMLNQLINSQVTLLQAFAASNGVTLTVEQATHVLHCPDHALGYCNDRVAARRLAVAATYVPGLTAIPGTVFNQVTVSNAGGTAVRNSDAFEFTGANSWAVTRHRENIDQMCSRAITESEFNGQEFPAPQIEQAAVAKSIKREYELVARRPLAEAIAWVMSERLIKTKKPSAIFDLLPEPAISLLEVREVYFRVLAKAEKMNLKAFSPDTANVTPPVNGEENK